MTKGVGYDQYYDSGGGESSVCFQEFKLTPRYIQAVEPSEAARSTLEFISTITHEKTGTFWAPRGPRCATSVLLTDDA
jgi:hypothetical protein